MKVGGLQDALPHKQTLFLAKDSKITGFNTFQMWRQHAIFGIHPSLR